MSEAVAIPMSQFSLHLVLVQGGVDKNSSATMPGKIIGGRFQLVPALPKYVTDLANSCIVMC